MKKVIGDKDSAEFKRLAVLHDPGAQDLDEVYISQADSQCREGAGHEQPIAGARVCNTINTTLGLGSDKFDVQILYSLLLLAIIKFRKLSVS